MDKAILVKVKMPSIGKSHFKHIYIHAGCNILCHHNPDPYTVSTSCIHVYQFHHNPDPYTVSTSCIHVYQFRYNILCHHNPDPYTVSTSCIHVYQFPRVVYMYISFHELYTCISVQV